MYKKFRFIDDGLAGDVYYPTTFKEVPRASGVFLYGLPSFIGQNEVTYALISANMISFQPHYYGTYDSTKEYSPVTAVETCIKTQSIFSCGFVKQTMKHNSPFTLPSLKICIGHSFGTLAALRSVRHLTTLDTLILLAPTVHYRKKEPNFGNTADGFAILESIRIGHPYTYRLAPTHEWQELMSGGDSIPSPIIHPSLKEVIAVAGEQDSYLDLDALEENLSTIVHAYCGNAVAFRLIRIPNGGHTMSDLVEVDGVFSLSSTCKAVSAR